MLQPALFQKPIPYAPEYEVDIFGNVFLFGKIQPSWVLSDGYFYVRIRRKPKALHRLVLLAFYGYPPDSSYEGCHRDGDRLNNCLTNLKWGTKAENTADKVRHGTHKKKIGSPNTKLNKKQILQIRKLGQSGKYTHKEIAEKFEISCSNVSKIISGNRWENIQPGPPRKQRPKSNHVQLELPF